MKRIMLSAIIIITFTFCAFYVYAGSGKDCTHATSANGKITVHTVQDCTEIKKEGEVKHQRTKYGVGDYRILPTVNASCECGKTW